MRWLGCSCCGGLVPLVPAVALPCDGAGPSDPGPAQGSALPRRAFLGGAAAVGVVGAAGVADAAGISDLLGSFVSPEQERALGAKAFQQLLRQTPRSRNALMQQRLEEVGRRVVAASGSAVPPPQWQFVVFQGEEANAFALPGGKVGAYEGIFAVMQNDAHLATVLGHEVGHVNARHAAARIGAEQASSLGTRLLAGAFGLNTGSGVDQLLGGLLGAGVQYGVLMPYNRSQELEADHLGLGYMARAGYDPRAAVSFWQAMMRAGGPHPPTLLSTHPSDAARIAQIEAALPQAEAIYRGRG